MLLFRNIIVILIVFTILKDFIELLSYADCEPVFIQDSLQNVQTILNNKVGVLQKKYLPDCNSSITSLTTLLTTVCTTTQSNVTIRTACMACFRAATANPFTTTVLSSLLPCVMLYFNNNAYSSCISILQNAVLNSPQVDTRTYCPSGYCSLVQCIRKINANSMITMCYVNSLPGNNVSTPEGRTNHYLLTTSCILAMARCNTVNPISGLPQSATINVTSTTKTVLGPNQVTRQLSLYNSLQVTQNGDLRIITMTREAQQTAAGFCLMDTSLKQASWGTITC